MQKVWLFGNMVTKEITNVPERAVKWFNAGYRVIGLYKGGDSCEMKYLGEIEDFDELYDLPIHVGGSIVYVRRHNTYYITPPEVSRQEVVRK